MSPTLRRLITLIRPHRKALIVAVVAAVVSILCGLASPLVVRALIDRAVIGRHRDLVLPLASLVLGFGILRAFVNFLRRQLAGIVSVRIEADLRNRLFAHLQGMPVSFHDQWQTGQLLARATGDLNAIRMFLGFGLVFLSLIVLMYVGVIATLFTLDVLLALVILALSPLLVATAIVFNKRVASPTERAREQLGELASTVEESAGGIRVLKAFGREEEAVERLERTAATIRSTHLEAIHLRARFVPTLSLLPNVMLAAVLGLGGWQTIRGVMTLGSLVAFFQYLGYLSWPLRNVGWILTLAQEADAAGKRVFEILDARPEIEDSRGALDLDLVDGLVEFADVRFTYPGATTPALDGVSLRIEPGETVALVGASGSGKSTLAALVSRFYDPQGGEVRLDGHPLPDLRLHALRRSVGVVFDEAILFSASVRDNITFGRPDATDDDVDRAAHVAGVDAFLGDLPDGIDTRVGEQGYGLSGGQRQRLALARALVTSPRVLVLDDPLSAVDAKTEAHIETHLARVMRGRTTILIAHRASTVAMADRVVVLEAGRVVAEGTHEQLLAEDAHYKALLAEELDAGIHASLEAVE